MFGDFIGNLLNLSLIVLSIFCVLVLYINHQEQIDSIFHNFYENILRILKNIFNKNKKTLV